MEVKPGAEIIGRFSSDEPVLDSWPAATRRSVGKGSVIKLAFWPKDDSVLRLFRDLLPKQGGWLADFAPAGFQAVPRSDGSLFVINTTPRPGSIGLTRAGSDRITGRRLDTSTEMKPYEVLWLE
jgi:hypothetical protein